VKSCPHCGGALDAAPSAHRSELERQLGDYARADLLRTAAMFQGEIPCRLDADFIAWRGYVWAKVRVRKAAVCKVSGAAISPGAMAWRQLSDVANRDWRVCEACWP
jgi:hypothetical protein